MSTTDPTQFNKRNGKSEIDGRGTVLATIFEKTYFSTTEGVILSKVVQAASSEESPRGEKKDIESGNKTFSLHKATTRRNDECLADWSGGSTRREPDWGFVIVSSSSIRNYPNNHRRARNSNSPSGHLMLVPRGHRLRCDPFYRYPCAVSTWPLHTHLD